MGAVGRSRAVRQSGDQAVRLSVLGIRLPAMENTTFPRPSPLVEPGTRYRVPGVRYRMRSDAEDRTPSPATGKRAPRVCILHLAYPMCGFFEDRWLVPGSRSRAPGTWDPGPDQRRGPDTENRRPSRKARYRKTRTQGLHPVSEGRIPSTEPEGQEAIRGCGRSHPFLG